VKPLPVWFRAFVRVISVIPALGSAFAWRLFWQLGDPAAVRAPEQAFHDSARVSRDGDIVSYSWGSGQRVVLLVHGWRSRASRFAAIGSALVERGYTVVSFDARGNGSSSGTRTHALEYADQIAVLGQRYGAFDAIIAHSLGAVAAFVAVRRGTHTRRLVTIGAPHDFESVIRTFTTAVGMPPAASRSLVRRVERWARPLGVDVRRELVSELDPTAYTTPLLVVHDSGDREAPLEQAMQIVEAHTGPVETLITDGLGHNRVMSDPAVVERIAQFVSAPIDRAPIGRAAPTR
jgi:pimeloyl-ACP methyl ester carboxylesterase